MNWEAFGVVVEAIGVVAVLVTLVYLSIQTRLTRIAVEEASEHSAQQGTNAAQSMYSVWRRTVFDCPELPAVLVKARGTESLTAQEEILFSTYFDELIMAAVTSYRSVIHETAGYTESIDVMHLLAHFNANPSAYQQWYRMSKIVAGISPEFEREVEDLISKATMKETQQPPNERL